MGDCVEIWRKWAVMVAVMLLCAGAAHAEVIVLMDRLDDYRQAVYADMQQLSPYELVCEEAAGSVQKQKRQFEKALAAQPDAIVLNPVSMQTEDVSDMLAQAQAAGVPLVLFNREPQELGVLIRYGDQVAYVGTDAHQAGRLQGEEIARLLAENPEYDANGDGVLQYMLLVGETGNRESDGRTRGCLSALARLGVAAEPVVPDVVCGWESLPAMEAVQAALYEGDWPEIIISNNDAMAIGAVAALNSAGINLVDGELYIPVIGVDATDDAIDLIRTGKLTATVAQDSEAMARAVLDIARAMDSGSTAMKAIAQRGYAAQGGLPVVRIDYLPYEREDVQ